MLREAEVFVAAEDMLVEVLGRIRREDEGIVLPPLRTGAGPGPSMAQAVQQHLVSDTEMADVLTGRPAEEPPSDVPSAAAAACAAARAVRSGDDLVLVDGEQLTVRDFLLRSTVERSLLAHYVAAHLGSTACPLPEELARPLHELTAPDAAVWRERGWFRDPLPLPDHVSWRDRFLLSAGHQPHPLGH